MAKADAQKLPCPNCQYQAWSQEDLRSHQLFSHGQGKQGPVQETPQAPPRKSEEKRLPPGMFIPQPQPDFWVSPTVGRELYIIGKLSERGENVNVMVVGPAGVGKTSLGWEFASAQKRPCFEVHCGMFMEPGEWWGKDRLSREQGTYYEQAKYVDAVETPYCVVILDEPNRCHPEVLNAQFALWDWRRAAWVPDLKRNVRVAPGVVFFGAMNEGAEYFGTNPMDKALRERFTRTIRLSWPPMKVEAKILHKRTGVAQEVADKLARFAADVRRNPKVGMTPSTRQLLVAAQDVAEGVPLEEAVRYAILNALDENADRKALLQHLQIIGKVDEAWVEGKDEADGQA